MEGPGAGTRDPLTLRFLDARLERDFQTEIAATNGAQIRAGTAVAVGLWLLAALIIPTAIVIDRTAVSVICLGMAGANLLGLVTLRWAELKGRGTLDVYVVRRPDGTRRD